MAFGLTSEQRRLLDFIRLQIAETGLAPSYAEMCAHLGLNSRSGVVRLIEGLQQRGHITRLPYKARSIALTAPADTVALPRDVYALLLAAARRRGVHPEALAAQAIVTCCYDRSAA